MDVSLTINDLFKILLYIAGIGALGYLIVVLKNLAKFTKEIIGIVEENEENIRDTIKEVPKITENVSSISKNADIALKEMTPEISNVLSNVNNISNKLGSITDSVEETANKALETADIVNDSVADTAYALKYNVRNINDYINIIIETIEVIKNMIKRK